MKNIITAIILGMIANLVLAKPEVGFTNLFYKKGVATPSIVAESYLAQKFVINNQSANMFNKTIITEINRQFSNINPEVQQILKNRESQTFTLFNGEPILKEWQRDNPHILESFLMQWVALYNGDQIIESMPPKGSSRQYILVGTLMKINQGQNNAILGDNATISLTYNLDLELLYLVIDASSQKVIAQFPANGHGGFSAFEPNYQTPVTYKPYDIVKMAIDNLSENIAHNILKIERFK